MAKTRIQKALKQPDEFVTFWTMVGDWASQRRRGLLIAAGAAAAVIALAVILVNITGGRDELASKAFSRIQKIAIAELIPAAGDAPKIEDDLPHFKTDRERREAALKETDAFLADHGGSPLKEEATLLKAGFLLDLGRPDEAIALYIQLLGGNLPKRFRLLAHEGLGYGHEAKGKLDDALAAFTRLASEAGDGFYKDRGLYHQARLTERKGDRKAAEKLYRDVLEKVPATALREEISNRLAVLETPPESK